MRGWSAMFADEARIAVGATQFGVARPGEGIALRHEIEIRMSADRELALASIDISNMHGSMDIHNIETQVQHRVPRMWPLLSRWFRVPRRHVYRDPQGALHPIVAQVGVDQGCPGSSTLACIGVAGLHESLAEHCFVAGLQDDTYLLMAQAGIKQSLEAIAPALMQTGCQLNFRKSGVWSPTCAMVVAKVYSASLKCRMS